MKKLIEAYFSYFIGLIAFILIGKYNISIIGEAGKLLELYATVSGTIFGFLLASLAILLQTGTEPLSYLRKERKVLFNKIITLNRKIVFISIVILLYSFCLLIYMSSYKLKSICEIHSQILASLLVVMFVDILYFLIAFYLSIHFSKKED